MRLLWPLKLASFLSSVPKWNLQPLMTQILVRLILCHVYPRGWMRKSYFLYEFWSTFQKYKFDKVEGKGKLEREAECEGGSSRGPWDGFTGEKQKWEMKWEKGVIFGYTLKFQKIRFKASRSSHGLTTGRSVTFDALQSSVMTNEEFVVISSPVVASNYIQSLKCNLVKHGYRSSKNVR